jgi:hypothetical protein
MTRKYVQALHRIMEQLLLRKQNAEEICLDTTLADVVYFWIGIGLLLLNADLFLIFFEDQGR